MNQCCEYGLRLIYDNIWGLPFFEFGVIPKRPYIYHYLWNKKYNGGWDKFKKNVHLFVELEAQMRVRERKSYRDYQHER